VLASWRHREFVDGSGHVEVFRSAQAIASDGLVRRVTETVCAVKSRSGEGYHTVDLASLTCDCEAFTYYGNCAHIVAAEITANGEETALAVCDMLRGIKSNRDAAVQASKRCPKCGQPTHLIGLAKLQIPSWPRTASWKHTD
jgi:hypothetical protein